MILTQADLNTAFSAEVLRQWADDNADGTGDSAILDEFITTVTNTIEGALKPWYPTVVPFSSGNVPDAVKEIALAMIGFRLASRKQGAAEHYLKVFQQAKTDLKDLAQAKRCLLFPDGTTVYSEGSSQAEPNGGAWASNVEDDRDNTFTDSSLKGF